MHTGADTPSNPVRSEKLSKLFERCGGVSKPLSDVAEYLTFVRDTSERWQKTDWTRLERDEDYALNDARIVGQVWFRGQENCKHGLKPGLYRDDTWQKLRRGGAKADEGEDLFDDLFDLEHEMRIDFTSYGHLLNESNQAKAPIDWYFLMQHHGVPTRLLDWSTNALAGLFFALEKYGRQPADASVPNLAPGDADASCVVAVWMIDAYWLADKLSDEWAGPLLPYSEDAAKYVPPLERLIERMKDARALVPKYAMPIEPPAMHPRVAAQEGRFIIFGRERDLLDQKIRLERNDDDCKEEELRVKQIRFRVTDHDAVLRELAQLGVSRRTLFPDLGGLAEFVRWKHLHKIGGYGPMPNSN